MHGNVDVLLLGAELLDQLPHVISVIACESVPEGQVNLRTVVGLATAGGLYAALRLTATRQREPRPGPGTHEQKLLTRHPATHRPPPIHLAPVSPLGRSFLPYDFRILTEQWASLPGRRRRLPPAGPSLREKSRPRRSGRRRCR